MFKRIITSGVVLLWAGSAFGAHPLITDDTGTQGKKKFQLEINSEFNYDKETVKGVTTKRNRGRSSINPILWDSGQP